MGDLCTSQTCVRFFEAQVLRDALRRLLTEIGSDGCESCNGTGGEPFGKRIYSRDRMEIVEDVITHYGDPTVDPCDDCLGTGVEL